MKLRSAILVTFVLLPTLWAQEQPATTSALDALREGDFETAIEGLSGDLKALSTKIDGIDEDELRLHQARAHHLAGHHAKAVTLCDKFLKLFPDSKWCHKMVFLKAEALAAQRKFAEALTIYQAEADRIFSEVRQDQVADSLVSFAELFATDPKPGDLDAPAPDYEKALILFRQVLDTNCTVAVREKVRSRIVTLTGKLQKWDHVIAEALAYLNEFDPSWKGTFQSVRRLTDEGNPKATFTGPNRFLVRYRHGEALHRLNQRPEAVRYLQELDQLIQDKAELAALRADSAWLRLMAMTNRGTVKQVDQWVDEAKAYLALYPNHIWAFQVSYKIATSYAQGGIWEKARESFQGFLDSKSYDPSLEDPLTLDVDSAGAFNDRKRRFEELRESASYEIGKIFLAEKKFNEAEAQWSKTAKDFPNGEKWAECQKGLVQVDFERALESVRKVHRAQPGKQGALREAAVKSLESFLMNHPLDPRLPQLMFALGEIPYFEAVAANDEEEWKQTPARKKAFERAISSWRRLVSKYPKSEQAKAAEIKIGGIYEFYLGDLERAIEIYSGLPDGRSRKEALLRKELRATSSQAFGTTEKPTISLSIRNIEKVQVRQYWIDFESYFRKSQNLADVENLDVDLVEPDKTWEVNIPNYQRYLPMEHLVVIPFEKDKAGVCVIKVEGDDLETTTVVVRSDIDLAIRNSKEESLVFVRDWKTGKPAGGVKIVLADDAKVIADGVTGVDGVWHFEDESLAEVGQLRVLGISSRGMAGHSLEIAGLPVPERISPVATLTTPRQIYRPGETVNLKVAVRDVKDGAFAVTDIEERDFLLKIRDESQRLLRELKVTVNDFGLSQVSFALPLNYRQNTILLSLEGLVGGEQKIFNSRILVGQQGLKRVKIDLQFEKKYVAPNEVIKGTISAQYRWGAPLANRKVFLNLPGGLTQELITDEAGEAKFEYPTQDSVNSFLNFTVSAPSTDANVGSGMVRIVERDAVIFASMKRSLVLAGRDFRVNLKAYSLEGKPLSRRLKIVLERPVEEHADPVLVAVPGLNIDSACLVVNQRVKEVLVTTGEKSGSGSATFKIQESGNYLYRVFDGDMEVASGNLTVSGDDDETKLRLFSNDENLFEGMVAKTELHSRLQKVVPALITFENDKLIEYRVAQVKPGSNVIEIPLTVAHTSHFKMNVMALDDRSLHQAGLSIMVRRKLEIEMTMEDVKDRSAKPGEKVRIKLLVKDAAGNPIEAETGITIVRKDESSFPPGSAFQSLRRPFVGEIFRSGSSCGFRHEGAQQLVNLAMQEELQRQVASGIALNDSALLPQRLNSLVQNQQSFGRGNRGQYAFFANQASPNAVPGGTVPSFDLGRSNVSMVFPSKGGLVTSFDLRSALVRTNGKGEAIIVMKLPDEPDEWVIWGEALTKNGAFGHNKESLVIEEAVVVSLDLPASISEGDSFHPRVTVSRRESEQESKATLKLEVKEAGKDAIVALKKIITFKRGQETVEVEFEKLAGLKGDLNFKADLQVGDLKVTRRRSLKVLPWGAPFVIRGGILARPGETSFKVTLPADAELEPVELKLEPSLSDYLKSLTTESSRHDARVPALGEHPAAALLTEIASIHYAQKRGQEMSMALIQESVGHLVAGVVISQGNDGGWSRQAGRSKSDLLYSTVAFEGLMLAKALNVAVDDGVLQRAETYLRGAISKSMSDDRAMIQYVLSIGGEGDFSACNRLFRSRGELTAFGKVHLAVAFVQLKRPEFARELLEAIGKLDDLSVETLGRALQGWAVIDVNAPQTMLLEKEIWKQCGADGFLKGLSRGIGALGLSSLYASREIAAEDFTCVISINGNQVVDVKSGTPESRGFVRIPGQFLKQGENVISVAMEGVGLLKIGTTITGISSDFPEENWNGDLRVIGRDFLHPGLSYRGLPLKANGRSPISKIEVGDRVKVQVRMRHTRRQGGEVILWEKIPAGFDYLSGSLTGGHSGARIENGYLVITHVGTTNLEKSFSYQMVAKTPGDWRVPPTTLFPLSDPERATYGPEGKVTILPAQTKANEVYQYQVAERYELAKLAFEHGEMGEAKKQLAIVRKENPNYQAAEVARMTLWIETSLKQPNARLVADAFEVLSELAPELEVPFSKILQVGDAYRKLKEFERGMGVFQATLEAGFATESFVGASLEDQGRYLDALDYQTRLWMDFPDQGEIANSWFTLGQQVYIKAAEAKNLTPRKGEKKGPTARELYLKSVAMLERFRVTHPTHPLADDGAFSIANALFTLQSYEEMVAHSISCRQAYLESSFAEAFQYLEALGNFWLRNYEAAFVAAKAVAEGSGKDRNLAAYICAQIRHAQGRPVDALKWYEKVKGEYPDARDSIAWFEQKKIALDEVTVVRSGKKVELELRHRNIGKVDLQIYRVDLMKLYLREKNLSNISKVNLAGISPKFELGIDFNNERFSDQETKVRLPVKDDGAYLVICRGDYLYTSGLILVTPLKMETQEDVQAGSVRVNMTDRSTGDYLDAVHVKAIGTENTEFMTGETDLRGVWKAEGVKGKATVIARDQEGRYAFYRGKVSIGMSPGQQRIPIKGEEQNLDYNGNNYIQQKAIWSDNSVRFDKLRRSNGKGVKVNKAIKK